MGLFLVFKVVARRQTGNAITRHGFYGFCLLDEIVIGFSEKLSRVFLSEFENVASIPA
jgi:hypothetical protein